MPVLLPFPSETWIQKTPNSLAGNALGSLPPPLEAAAKISFLFLTRAAMSGCNSSSESWPSPKVMTMISAL